MPLTDDEMIAALDAFKPHPQSAGDLYRLYKITNGFDTLPNKAAVMPAMFALMERCPAADLGSPGPMVHAIESLGVETYEAQLAQSVRRRPMYLNVWMVNRILNAERRPASRQAWVRILREVLKHPFGADVSELARNFLQRHGDLEPG